MKNIQVYIGILSVSLVLFVGCSAESTTDVLEKMEQVVVDEISNHESKDNPYVQTVKNGVLESYPNKAIGEAFGSFFSDPKWKHFKADTKEEVVEFTGYCQYSGVQVLARVQFIVDGEKIEVGAVDFNDVPQNRLITVGLFEKIYESDKEESLEQEENSTGTRSNIDGQYFTAGNYIDHITERTDGVTVIGADASSKLANEGVHTYEPLQSLDNDYSTAWVEGVSGNGEGEWISYNLEKESVVQVIAILNGLASNEDLYYANNRAKEVEITFSSGETITMLLSDDNMELQAICLPEEIKTDSIDIRIISTYPGSKYDDTCISEVEIMYYHQYTEEGLAEEIVDNVENTGQVMNLDMSLIELLYEDTCPGYTDYIFKYGDLVYLLRWWEEENKPIPDFQNGPISIVETGEEEYVAYGYGTYAIVCELP